MKKMAIIICNVSSLEVVTQLVKRLKTDFYQIVMPTIGLLPFGEPRMNNAVWPGYSVSLFLKMDVDELVKLRALLTTYNADCPTEDEQAVLESWTID